MFIPNRGPVTPWTRQPPNNPRLNYANPLLREVADVWVGSHPHKTLVHRFPTFWYTTTGSPKAGQPRPGGRAAHLPAAASNTFYISDTSAPKKLIPSSTEITFAFVYRYLDTTARTSFFFGYNVSTSNRVMAHFPYSGTAYWDCGNFSTNRISVAMTKNTNIETAIFTGGPARGQEIWRAGIRIANDVSKKPAFGTRPAVAFAIGGSDVLTTMDPADRFLFVAVGREWTTGECQSFSKNPWQIFA